MKGKGKGGHVLLLYPNNYASAGLIRWLQAVLLQDRSAVNGQSRLPANPGLMLQRRKYLCKCLFEPSHVRLSDRSFQNSGLADPMIPIRSASPGLQGQLEFQLSLWASGMTLDVPQHIWQRLAAVIDDPNMLCGRKQPKLTWRELPPLNWYNSNL